METLNSSEAPPNPALMDRGGRESQWTTERKTGLAFAVAMAILLTNGFFLYQSANRQVETSARVEHAREVMGVLDQITFHLSDAENARRGFILTSSSRYLAHFKTATNRVAMDFAQLKRLTANHQEQQNNVEALKPQIDRRFLVLKNSIQWQQEHGPDPEKQAAFMDIGQSVMEPIRQTTIAMVEIERRLLESRRTEALKGIQRTTEMTLIGTGLSIGILSWAFLLLVRENVRRRAAEEAIRGSNDELEQRVASAVARAEQAHEFRDKVMESAVFGFGALDLKGNFTMVNQHFADIMGYRIEEMIGLSYVQLVSPQNLAVLSKYFFRVINNRSPVLNREVEVIRRDGGSASVVFSWSPMTLKSEVIGVVGTAMDVTAHKQAEAEIRRLNRELEKRVAERTAQLQGVNKELEAFSYSVSHDLRAPLRHVDGFVDMLRQHSAALLDDKGRRYLDIISDSAKQMGTLIDDLLDFSRVGRSDLKRIPVDMNRLVKEALHELEPDLRAREIKWTIGTLPAAHADRAMLKLVWTNLLSNAVKYTRPRARTEIEIGSRTVEDNRQEFFVRDNGVGFDMRYADKLFGVFQRLHRADEFEGTGIGLANVRRIVTRHGGSVRAEAVLNEGATFSFSLPVVEQEPV
ncbi:MAG: CHASE3 domain-containing protein [Opitutaceae bacterium]|nr:CHASE3 domain-containing protein [Verrucomicrobiales bacterium]